MDKIFDTISPKNSAKKQNQTLNQKQEILRKDGFCYEFDPSFCQSCGGKCCTGESGLIWINASERERLAMHLGISQEQLEGEFLFKHKGKFSIKERAYQDGFACLFFDDATRQCLVYEARPSQCRTFPFWDYFKQNLKELEAECIGVKFL